MKVLDESLTIEDNKSYAFITIDHKIPRWQETVLLVWAVGWTFCGLAVLIEMFGLYTSDQKMMMMAYMLFWGYFEFKMVKAFVWKKYGKELIKIDSEGLTYKRDYNSYGIAKNYFKENISGFDAIDVKRKSFASAYFTTFWSVGHENISFQYLGKSVMFGLGIPESTRDKLLKLVRSQAKRRW